ncbi:MAG: TatD family hydrolase [Gemmatimonadales bacterium]|nr:TatD family hydrolase [Gemmatimonadales bacterium]
MLVDSHCHLGDAAFDADRVEVVERARAAGVGVIIVVADTVAASDAAVAISRSGEGLAATAGIHPHQASEFEPASALELERLFSDPAVVAVGETGLDYHYDHSPRDRQREAFAWHLGQAAERGKPAIIHSREADEDTARLLSEAPAGLTGVLHCFSSGPAVLDAALARGLLVSWSGMITFRKWDAAWAVERVPDDRLLIETDAPYLAPVPYRGKRNEPGFLPATAKRLAEIRGTTPERIAELTGENARRLFKLPSREPGAVPAVRTDGTAPRSPLP